MAGKPQTLTQGQQEQVVGILKHQVTKWCLCIIAVLTTVTGVGLWQIGKSVHAKMEALVASQFEEPRIQSVVQRAAAERASLLISNQIAPEVALFKSQVVGQVNAIDALVAEIRKDAAEGRSKVEGVSSILADLQKRQDDLKLTMAEADSARRNLQEIADFQLLVVRALGDDATAWDELGTRSFDPDDPFHREAASLYVAVAMDFVGPFPKSFTTLSEESIQRANSATSEQLKNISAQSDGVFHTHLLELAWGRTNLSKFQKLSFMAFMLERSPSLNARAAAGRHIADESKQYYRTLRSQPWLEWWRTNKSRIEAESQTK